MPSIAFKRNALRQIKELGSNLPRCPKRYAYTTGTLGDVLEAKTYTYGDSSRFL